MKKRGASHGAGMFCQFVSAIVFTAFLISPSAYGQGEFLRVGYINYSVGQPWKNYDQLFDGTYTHIITTFLIPDSSGAVVADDAADSFVIARIHEAQAAGSKVLVSIGGSTVSYSVFRDIAYDPVAHDAFIANVLAFIAANDYDGIDINFEGWWYGDVGAITQNDVDQVDQLALDLAQALKDAQPGSVVTVTLAPLYFLPVNVSCNVINSDLIDLAHHMSYDFMSGDNQPNGPFRAPGTTQWLYFSQGPVERSVYGAFDYLDSKGCSRAKITGGIPFYSSARDPWNSVRGSADWGSVALHADYLEKQHPVDGYWVNDAEAIEAKIEEYKDLGLAGVMVWQVGHEGTTGDLSQALYDAATRPTPTPTPWAFPRRVNFQPPASQVPDGCVADGGTSFAASGEYGWR